MRLSCGTWSTRFLIPLCSSIRRRSRGDVGVEDERVPRESPARPKRGMDALEARAAGRPRSAGGSSERAGSTRARRAPRARIAHVRLPQFELDACRLRALAAPARASRGRAVDAEHVPSRLPATGIATLPFPTASSTSGPPSPRRARRRTRRPRSCGPTSRRRSGRSRRSPKRSRGRCYRRAMDAMALESEARTAIAAHRDADELDERSASATSAGRAS